MGVVNSITEEERMVAHQLLDQLLDEFPEKNFIYWERAQIEDLHIRRTRFEITAKIQSDDD